jgi:MSHA pilin protein MshC
MPSGPYTLRNRGFTLIELVTVMILIGILAIVAVPKFANTSAFETRGFSDQTLATLQYGRKVAVAAGRNVCASATGNTLTLTMATNRGQSQSCAAANAVGNPAANWKTFSGISYGSALSTTFHADGSAAAASFTVSGDSTYTLVVESTGYVHCNPVSTCS